MNLEIMHRSVNLISSLGRVCGGPKLVDPSDIMVHYRILVLYIEVCVCVLTSVEMSNHAVVSATSLWTDSLLRMLMSLGRAANSISYSFSWNDLQYST